MMQTAAPAPTPATVRQRAAVPRGQACDSANNPRIAEAGAAGYSVTVAHPAARPVARAHRKSARAVVLSRSLSAAANAKTKHEPTRACAQNRLAYAQSGVAREVARVPNMAALVLPPNRRARKNKQIPASAVGNAAVHAVTTNESTNSPREDCGSTPIARIAG